VGVKQIRIVTRGSELALWQTHWVAEALKQARPGIDVAVQVVKTTGDKILDVPLAKIGDKGLFTKELDHALLNGEADLAVHSLKDVPTRLPDGLALAAVSEREDVRDVLIGREGFGSGGLHDLPAGARIGTSSLRRRAQLHAARPDVEVLDLRGNLNTRLAKLDRGEYDAIVLAAAGVVRLGWHERISARLDSPAWLPAVGQGALGVVTREADDGVAELLAGIHDPDTAATTAAERALLRALEGGCQIPIGAHATIGAGELTLHALVADLNGERILRETAAGAPADAVAIGRRAADALLQRGAGEILAEIRQKLAPPPPAP
jgi:hydroxymethylbilane synthase